MKKLLEKGFRKIGFKIFNLLKTLCVRFYESHLGYKGKNVIFGMPVSCSDPQNIYLYENVNIYEGSIFIGHEAKFIMKKNSGAAQGLTVVTNIHHRIVGIDIKTNTDNHIDDEDKDVIVEEDVWIASNVTLLAGCHIGRGATLGAGAVVRSNIPPYAIVIGNPGKIIGFSFTPEEVKTHEEKLYDLNDRISIEDYERLYNKFYLDKISEIKQYVNKKL